jgi:hypothetical protein
MCFIDCVWNVKLTGQGSTVQWLLNNASFLHLERRVWRYQRGNQNPYIEEEQTTQWPKETVQKNKQRSTKHTYKTKDRVTRTPLKTGGELRCSGRVSSSCSTSDTHRVNLVTKPVISHLRHRYSITVNQVVVATIKHLKW